VLRSWNAQAACREPPGRSERPREIEKCSGRSETDPPAALKLTHPGTTAGADGVPAIATGPTGKGPPFGIGLGNRELIAEVEFMVRCPRKAVATV
jgi:hypothetical protein